MKRGTLEVAVGATIAAVAAAEIVVEAQTPDVNLIDEQARKIDMLRVSAAAFLGGAALLICGVADHIRNR